MPAEALHSIFLDAAIVNNFVLALFLGMLSSTAGRRSGLVSSMAAYGINWVLTELDLLFLRLICFIAVIASAVQLVEMFVKRYSPALFRSLGIFLPLITTNCAILGLALFQTSREYDFVQSLVYALGAGVGFMLALMLMAGLREKLELARVPDVSQGAALSLMLAGLLSLAFMGFAGLGGAGG